MSYALNIAHVQDGTGTFVLPAHSPYDRQILREHIEKVTRRVARLTLGVQGTQWIVTRGAPSDSRCACCTESVGALSCSRSTDTDTTCIDCAMRSQNDQRREWRHA